MGIVFAILVICVPEKCRQGTWKPERAGEMPGGRKSWGWKGRTSLPGKPHLDSIYKYGRGEALVKEKSSVLAEEQINGTWSQMYRGVSSALKSHPFQICPGASVL